MTLLPALIRASLMPCEAKAAARLLMAAALASCSVGPHYTRPQIAVPPRWSGAPDTTASLADLSWWQVFQDPVLHELIRTALSQNKDVRLAIARVSESRGAYVVQRSFLFPHLDARATYTGQRYSRTSFPFTVFSLSPDTTRPPVNAEQEVHTTVFDLSYEIDLFGRLRQATKAARADNLSTASAARTVLITLLSDVAQAYFELLELDSESAISRSTVQSRQASLTLVRQRFAAGVTSELDVRRAEQELASAAATVPSIERAIAQTENRLNVLLGREPTPIPRGMTLDAQTVPPATPAGLPAALLQRRPDIREAEQRLMAATARTRAAIAEFFPKLSLTGWYGTESGLISQLYELPSRTWQLAPTVTLPVFQGGQLRGNLEANRAREQQALASYQQTILQAFREVNDALVFQRTARETRVQRETEVAAARRSLELANLRYADGLGTYLDVLDAERQLFGAEIELASIMRDQLTAVVQLYKALGGGWGEDIPIPRMRPEQR